MMASRDIVMDKVEAAVCALLLLAVVAGFGQTVQHGFLNFDDDAYVYDNRHVSHGLTASGVVWAFSQGGQASWIPLTWLSLMLDCQFYDLHAGGHHLTNVLLHAVTAMLLFLVLRRMTARLWPSALVAALFAVHPLRTESVAWVTERKDVLSGLFFMLTLWAYLEYVRHGFSWARYALLIVLFALGLMAKPMLVTVPFLLLVLDYWPLGRMVARPRSFRPLIIEKVPLFALAAGECLVMIVLQGSTHTLLSSGQLPLWWRLGNAALNYATYLGQFFYPAGLVVVYPRLELALPWWQVGGACLLLAGITAAAFLSRRKCPYLLVGWLWYLGMLVPVIGLLQVGTTARADRFTYLPQIGLAVALVWGVAHACQTWPSRRWACGAAAATVLAAILVCTFRQTSFWGDTETLWARTIALTSRNYVAHNALGALIADERLDEAIAQFRQAIAISPLTAPFHMNLADALMASDRSAEAEHEYRQVLKLYPHDAQAFERLGLLVAKRGQLDEAIAYFRRSLDINPDNADTCYDLGKALVKRGRPAEARKLFQKATEIVPDYVAAHDQLGRIMADHGQFRGAIRQFERALDGDPQCRSARLNLGKALADCGRFAEAVAQYRTALRLDPHDPEACGQLTRLLTREKGPSATP
jgi:Flp pilus assembly protein TadD